MKLNLKQARLLSGFSQAEVAKALGISRTTYTRLEKIPKLSLLLRLKQFLTC